MSNKFNLRLCAHDLTVKIECPGSWSSDGMGRSDEMNGEILLREGMPPSIQCATLLHEVVHMILGIHGLTDENNEVAISTLAAGILSLLRDNPGIGAALINCESLEDYREEEE